MSSCVGVEARCGVNEFVILTNSHLHMCVRAWVRRMLGSSDFHTWNHVELSSALHAFAKAGYRILGISDARLDNRAAYGTLVHMEFVLLRDPTVIHWQERVRNSIAALGARNCVLMCAPIAVYETTRRSRWRNHRRSHE